MLGDTKWLAQGHMAKSEFYLSPPTEGRPAYGSSPPTPFRIPQNGRDSLQAQDATSSSVPLDRAWAGPVPATLRITLVVLGMDH